MIAIITKISEGKVWAKTVNQYEINPTDLSGLHPSEAAQADQEYWQQAESERIELELHKDNCLILPVSGVVIYHHHAMKMERIKIGDTIQVTREGNYFKII